MPEPPPQELETLRLHQANERTMLAWIRTGIALMAFGFAVSRFGLFLQQLAAVGTVALGSHHGLGSAWLGGGLVAIGMSANLLATVRYGRIRHGIQRGEIGPPSAMLVYALGAATALIGLVMTVLLVRSVV